MDPCSSATTRKQGASQRLTLIALFGLFGSGNTGNDASLEVMLATVQRLSPAAQVLCICGDPRHILNSFSIPTAPIYGAARGGRFLRKFLDFGNAYRQLHRCELMIVPGTGALDDFGTGWTGLPLAFFSWCLAARLRGAKIAFVSVGAGPIKHPFSRLLLKAAVRMASYRSYRDRISKDFLTHIGVDTTADSVYPDLTFSLPVTGMRKTTIDYKGALAVGLGLMTYQGWYNDEAGSCYPRYLEKITEFAIWLFDHGHSVRLLIGDHTDLRAVRDLQTRIAEKRPSLSADRCAAVPCRSLHDLMREIAKTDVVVATRFHNVVCALKLARPVISVGYADKNDALMTEAGLGRFCQAIESLDVDLLIRQFTELTADADIWHQVLRGIQPRYRARLAHQESALAAALFQHPAGATGFL